MLWEDKGKHFLKNVENIVREKQHFFRHLKSTEQRHKCERKRITGAINTD